MKDKNGLLQFLINIILYKHLSVFEAVWITQYASIINWVHPLAVANNTGKMAHRPDNSKT